MKRIAIDNLATVTDLTKGELQNTIGGLKREDILRLVRTIGCFLAGRSKKIRNSSVYKAICG